MAENQGKLDLDQHLASMSSAELLNLVSKAQKLEASKKEQERADAKKKLEELADKLGVKIPELFAGEIARPAPAPAAAGGEKKTRSASKVWYRHPEEANVFYKAAGKPPAWFSEVPKDERHKLAVPNPELTANTKVTEE